MFYSHTFLARKTPLGTVWIAAHLERRIKKPQIDNIDIPSYAECIMFPEVPIALRLSGHLLLGLVRIYSWKVNYLFQDCNRMLSDIRTAFATVQIDLPVEADHAPFESVTLPETFELDALELDDSVYQTDGPDNHRKTYDQITLTDNTSGGEQYVAFMIDEDNRVDSVTQPEISNTGAALMDEDILPPFEGSLEAFETPVLNTESFRDSAPSNQAEGSGSSNQRNLVQELPEIEIMREAVQNSELQNLQGLVDVNNEAELLHESSFPAKNGKDSLSPIMEGVAFSGGESFPMPPVAEPTTVASIDDPHSLDAGIPLGHPLPDLELQPSPPVQEQRKRKRKQFYDETLVLTNAEMKRQLEDTSRLLRKRRRLPCAALDVWRFRKTLQKERIFYEPLLSGMCTDLQEAFKKSFPLLSVDSAHVEASPGLPHVSSHNAFPEADIELEVPRFDTSVEGNLPELNPSPSRREELTPLNKTLDSAPGAGTGSAFETEVLPTFESTLSAGQVGTEPPGTPLFNLEEEQPFVSRDDIPEIPGLLNSADGEDLNFLEASSTSSGSDGMDVGSMSARTRAVAQYLKEHTPSTPSKNQTGNISLNKILEGKTRKQCARMFFETLVLKSCDLIDVQQEEAYGDILISAKPALSAAKF
uniref:Sister chromatid cohesion 1 protein 3 n=1 Tax=Ananas comosus var. bracteatus TaxID=296719 RepID=A0A6V7QAK8_ANACO|nr:unnamed protein product [Ananas comosus var. bracteatus]